MFTLLGDELHGIIYLPQLMYKKKYLRLICFCYPFVGIGYLCLLLRYAVAKWEDMVSLDILIAALCVEVTPFECFTEL